MAEQTRAINTQDVYLLKKGSSNTWAKLVDIKDFPDLGSSVSSIETTTLSNHSQTYIDGLHQLDALEFTCNYDKSDFSNLNDLEIAHDVLEFAVCFKKAPASSPNTGEDFGVDGVFKIKGYLNVGVSGGGVDEVVEMTVTLTPTDDIEYSDGPINIAS